MKRNQKREVHLTLVAASAALCVVGLASLSPTGASAQNVATPQPQNGRYVIVHSPHVRADTFLIDTATGRTWSLITYSYIVDEPRAWTAIPQLNGDADVLKLEERNGLKPKPPQSKVSDLPTTGK